MINLRGKIFVLLMALILTATLVAGCGGSGNTAKEPAKEPAKDAPKADSAVKP